MKKHEFVRLFPKSPKRASVIFDSMDMVNIDYLKQEFSENKVGFVTVFQEAYPPLLKQIYDAPWVLYFKGRLSIVNNNHCLSVVGTRHPSPYSKHEMNAVLAPVTDFPVTIVSGMALGIDAAAHEIALKTGNITAAVLGYGFEHTYPASLNGLKETLGRTQLLLSEYPPYVRPERWRFPERNRIISGLSKATLIIEAKRKSGSLITADCALSQDRDVFAFPGRLSDPESQGTNILIQQGAKMILQPDDILEEYV